MTGDWAVKLRDGATHAIHAEIIWIIPRKLHITWGGVELVSSKVIFVVGDLSSFERNGHSFLLRDSGVGRFGRLVLFQDGVKVAKQDPLEPMLIEECNVEESEEIIGIGGYPLDNLVGDQPIMVEREVARGTTNELTVETESSVNLGLGVTSAITAQIGAQVSKTTGRKVGEKENQRQNVKFGWKRRILNAKRHYFSDGKPVKVLYRAYYGLYFEQNMLKHRANS
jgi:hypothetical protein